jgi:hypothetical protein
MGRRCERYKDRLVNAFYRWSGHLEVVREELARGANPAGARKEASVP